MYFYYPDSADLIGEHLPDVKLIFLLRNPIDRAFSDYWHENRFGFKKSIFPNFDVMAKENHPRFQHYRNVSSYKKHLGKYYSLFPKENILVMLFDDFVADTPGAVKQICEFLNVDSEYEFDFERKSNQFIEPRFGWLQRAMEKVSFSGIGRNMPIFLRRPLGKVKQVVRRVGSSNKRPEMSSELRAELVPRFEEDIAYVEELLGRDLSHWREV
ncbi:MAG: sulfotransferase [bacterium]